jgi:hypothetical protein
MDLLQYGLHIDEWQLGFILMHLIINSWASKTAISVAEIYCSLARIILTKHDFWDINRAFWSTSYTVLGSA